MTRISIYFRFLVLPLCIKLDKNVLLLRSFFSTYFIYKKNKNINLKPHDLSSVTAYI